MNRPGLPDEIKRIRDEVVAYARAYGLDFYDTIFEMVDLDGMLEVASYGGFPNRYPHWRFGMDFEELDRTTTYGLSRIYELVLNTDPCYAYLLRSNSLTEQKIVIAHVLGHSDFFKNNQWFSATNRKMLDEMANHAVRVRRIMDRVGVEPVEDFIDTCLSLENILDVHAPFIRREFVDSEDADDGEEDQDGVRRLRSKDYMDSYINPKEFLEAQRRKVARERERRDRVPPAPVKDIPGFLLDHAPLEMWEWEILSMVREEAYYFVPQRQTKIMNEGWACVAAETPVFTDAGIVSMADVVSGGASAVWDGEAAQGVYDRHVIRDHETVTVTTRRGLTLTGSNNHRVLLSDGASWKRLDELAVGDRIAVSGGGDRWPESEVPISWKAHERVGLADVADRADVSLWTVLRDRAGRVTRNGAAIAVALEEYERPENQALPASIRRRAPVRIPRTVTGDLATFLGYLVGDGQVSRVKRHFGVTTGDEEPAARFAALGGDLFGIPAVVRKDGGRWRVLFHSETVSDFLVEALGLTTGPSAREKHVPLQILRSPEPVARAFLRALYDCDGHAGPTGVILSTTSAAMAEDVQLLLLNYGILSQRCLQKDGCYHLHVTGTSAARFAERIGFGLRRKQRALETYVGERRWFKQESWDDEVVALAHGRADVYDISVTATHRYAAAGFVNHNSYWHSKIMTERALGDGELVDYADRHSGTMGQQPGSLNPYKLGLELLRDIEDRWNRGAHGAEYEDCPDIQKRAAWNLRRGEGMEKIFEVRRVHNDVTFIDSFLTEEFCRKHRFFTYGYDEEEKVARIESRDFREIKERLLFSLTNFGQPFIYVEDANFRNRGELLLTHRHEGHDLRLDWTRDTLERITRLWRRPVHLLTEVKGKHKLFGHDGEAWSEEDIEGGGEGGEES